MLGAVLGLLIALAVVGAVFLAITVFAVVVPVAVLLVIGAVFLVLPVVIIIRILQAGLR